MAESERELSITQNYNVI